jgi:2-hydroxycyclohexanecarboxyl-CoA dehydrogenase
VDLGLAGKGIIVTGGGSNIGRAITLTLAGEGANILIADLDETQAARVAVEADALGAGGQTLAVETDVTKPASIEAAVDRAVAKFGQVDVLVSNVGWTHDQLFLDKPLEEFEREIQLNLWGGIHSTRAVLPRMAEQGSGRVVYISSDAGRMGEYRESVYSACKAGLIALAKSLSREYGKFGVTFNAVCPGLTVPDAEQEMGEGSMWRELSTVFTPEARERASKVYPLRRLGTAQDPANAVAFLASEAAGFITGQTLSVSGGYTMQ